jgi:iron complex transport system permease protein
MKSLRPPAAGSGVLISLLIILLAEILLSLSVGRYSIPLGDLTQILTGPLFNKESSSSATMKTVVFNVRIPRICAALLVGLALAGAGTAYQALFRNPMVSPDILGASSGAGFGAAFAILSSFPAGLIQLSAFLCGLMAVLVTWIVGSTVSRGNSATLALVLTGMVVSSLFTAFISMTKFVADPYNKLPAITFWLMGGLSSIGYSELTLAGIPILAGLVPLAAVRWRLNVLSFGDEEARALGVNTKVLRLLVIVCSTLLSSAAVSAAGMVGWVGLVVPHLARMLVGPDCRILLPTSLLLGAGFLLLVDDIARCAFAMEIPLGILTALAGAPFFLLLIARGRKGWASC